MELLQIAARQRDNSRRQADAFTVVGDSLCHFGCTFTINLVRSFREANARSSEPYFGSDGDYRDRHEMEAKTACVVLDYHGLAALHVPVVLLVPWTTKWVPAFAIIPIGVADLYIMLWVLSFVGNLVKRSTISKT
jgi:hypothetical protein